MKSILLYLDITEGSRWVNKYSLSTATIIEKTRFRGKDFIILVFDSGTEIASSEQTFLTKFNKA